MVIGIGILVGGVPTVFHFFVPRQGNPWVPTWFAALIAIHALGTRWIFFPGGAEVLARHNGIFSRNARRTSPGAVKPRYLFMLVPGIVAMVAMFLWNSPLPNF